MGTTDTIIYVSGEIMSCNYPMLAIPDGTTKTGKTKYTMLGRYDESLSKDYPDAIKLPCGKCSGCRAAKCREWADRMILELDHSGDAVFLTLTYNDACLPVFLNLETGQVEASLLKRDLQLFMKRLRKRFKNRELRMYACGEYGSTTHRPHYHMILYGVSLQDFPDLSPRGTNELGQQYFSSDFLANEVWKNGFCLLSDVSWNTMAYVSRYVKKKDYGLASEEYTNRITQPEFSVMSRNPGIGMYYVQEHEDWKDKTKYYLSSDRGSIEVYFPKAFLKFLEKTDPDFYAQLKEQRKRGALDSEIAKLCQTDLSSMELDQLHEKSIERTSDLLDRYRTQV